MDGIRSLMGLKAYIKHKYRFESTLARDLGWSKQKLNSFTTGERIPDLADVKAMSDKLGIPIDIMIDIFLPKELPNG